MTSKQLPRPDVLILGFPRSGTTWLAKIFDTSPRVLYRHEPDSVCPSMDVPVVPSADEASSLVPAAGAYLSQLANVRHVKASGSLPLFDKDFRSPQAKRIRHALIVASKALAKGGSRVGVELNLQVPDLVAREHSSEVLRVIKSVDSLSRAFTFSLAAPSLKILHIVRHPCACIASLLRGAKLNLISQNVFLNTQVKLSEASGNPVTHDELEKLTREQQLASLWMLLNQKVMAEMSNSPNYRLVVYEELCADPIGVVNELFEFSGVPYSEQTDNFLMRGKVAPASAAGYFDVVQNSDTASMKWKKELAAEQIEKIMTVVSNSEPGLLFR